MKKQTTKRKINHNKTKKKNHVNKRTKSRKLIGGVNFVKGEFVFIKNDNSRTQFKIINVFKNGKIRLFNPSIGESSFKILEQSDIEKIPSINPILTENNENNENNGRRAYERIVGHKAATPYNTMVMLGNVSDSSSSNYTNQNKNNKSVIDLYSILGKFDYFCFDFDDTIAHNEQGRGHLSLDLKFIKDEDLVKYFYDATNLIKLISYLLSNGKKIFIISFGDPDVITSLLNRLINYYYTGESNSSAYNVFETDVNVFGLLKAGHNQTNNNTALIKKRKVDIMQRIIKKNTIEQIKKILFFDDDYKNTRAMNEIGISAITIPGRKTNDIGLVPKEDFRRYGFGLDILNKLERDIEKRKLQPSKYMIKENYLFESFDEYRSLSVLNRLKIARDEMKKKAQQKK